MLSDPSGRSGPRRLLVEICDFFLSIFLCMLWLVFGLILADSLIVTVVPAPLWWWSILGSSAISALFLSDFTIDL